jgi:DNA-binding transcriptional MerR regulator
MYKIGEFSRLSQVPIRTLRYYDQIGLLVPAQVGRTNGYRGYAAEQFERLNRILVFKDLGLSLHEIRLLLADRASTAEIHGLVRRKHAELAQRVEAERLRLARATVRLALMEGNATISDIAVRAVAPHWVASVRDTIRSHDDCDRLLDELGRLVRGHRAQRPPQRGAIWHVCERGRIDCEAFEIVPRWIAPKGRLSVRQVPAHAYRAMRAWIDTSDLAITGPKRELFLRGGESVTEVQFPVELPIHRRHDAPEAGQRTRPPHATRSAR